MRSEIQNRPALQGDLSIGCDVNGGCGVIPEAFAGEIRWRYLELFDAVRWFNRLWAVLDSDAIMLCGRDARAKIQQQGTPGRSEHERLARAPESAHNDLQ